MKNYGTEFVGGMIGAVGGLTGMWLVLDFEAFVSLCLAAIIIAAVNVEHSMKLHAIDREKLHESAMDRMDELSRQIDNMEQRMTKLKQDQWDGLA